MNRYENKQLCVGDLKKYFALLPDDIQLFVGWGERSAPLRFMVEHGDNGIMFHPDVYECNASETNINTILSFYNQNK